MSFSNLVVCYIYRWASIIIRKLVIGINSYNTCMGSNPRINVQEGHRNFWRAITKLPLVCKGTKAIAVGLKRHLGKCQKCDGHQGNCTRNKVEHENNMQNKYQSKKETIICTRHYVIVNFILTKSI